jgi:D-3-phosphoglycerate dehydrogenase
MKILANDGISTSGETLLIEAGHEILNHRVSQEHLVQFINENQVEILLVKNATSIDHQVIDSCKSLKIIGKAGTEMNNVAVDYAIEKGLYVISTPNSYARATAELVFAHFFSLARFLHDSNRMMPLEGDSKFNLLKKSYQNAAELFGKTLGVIGSGNNALEVIKMGISLGMNVIIFNEISKSEKVNLDFFDGQKLVFELKSVKFEEILEKSDFISILNTEKSGYLIDSEEFEIMKNGAYLVNIAKGAVNEVTLVDYLENKKLAGAALDVFEYEPKPDIQVLMNPSLSLSPNLASVTTDAIEKTGKELAEQIIKISREYYAHI